MAIARLADDLRVSRHVLAPCLRAVVAQRLCPRVCRTCKAPAPLPAELLEAGITSGECFVAARTTCEMCSGSGYKGRAAVHEVVAVQGELEAALRLGEASPQALQRAALASGMQPLRRDALLKVSLGRTDLAAARAALGGAWAPTA
jgi:type IV pilus assembly protein PilB